MATVTFDNGTKMEITDEQEYHVIWRDDHVVVTLRKDVDRFGNDV